MSQPYFQYFTITILALSMGYANEIVTEEPPGDENLNYTTVTSFTTAQNAEETTTSSDYETTASNTEEAITLPPVFDVAQYESDCPPGGIVSRLSCEEDTTLWEEYGESLQEMSEGCCDEFQDVINDMMYYSCSPSAPYAEDALMSSLRYMDDCNMEFPENITNPQLEMRKQEYIESFDTIRNMEQALNLSEQVREGYIKMIYQAHLVKLIKEYKEKSTFNTSERCLEIEQEENLLKKYKEYFRQLSNNFSEYLEQTDVENIFNSGKLALILNSSLDINNTIQQYPIQEFIIKDKNERIVIQHKIKMLNIEDAITLPPVFDVTQYENDCPPEGFSSPFSCEEDEILWIEYGERIPMMSEKLCDEFQDVIKEMMYYSCSPSASYAEDALISSTTYMEKHNMKLPDNITNSQQEVRKQEYIKSFDIMLNMEQALNFSEQVREDYKKMIYQARLFELLEDYKEKRGFNTSESFPEIEQEENLLKKYKESFGPLGEKLAKYLEQNNLKNVFKSGKLALIVNSSLYIRTHQQFPIQEFIIEDNKMGILFQRKIKMLTTGEAITFPLVFDVKQYKNDCPPDGYGSPFSCENDEILWIQYGERIQRMSEKLCDEFQNIIREIMYYSCNPSPSFAEDALRSSKSYMEHENVKLPENITNPELRKRKEEYIKSFDTIRNMEQALNLSEKVRESYKKIIYQARIVELLEEYIENRTSNRSDVCFDIEQEDNLLKEYKTAFGPLGEKLAKYLDQNNLENILNSGTLALIVNSSRYISTPQQFPIQEFIIDDNQMRISVEQKVRMLITGESIRLPPVFDVKQYKNDCPPDGFGIPFSCEKDEILWIEYGESTQTVLKKFCDKFQFVIREMMYYSCYPSASNAEDALISSTSYIEQHNVNFPENITNPEQENRKKEYINSLDTIRNMKQALNLSEQMREVYIKVVYQARLVKFLEDYKQKRTSNKSHVYLEIEQEEKLLKKYKDSLGPLGKNLATYLEQNDLGNVLNSGKLALILNSSLYITFPTQQSPIQDFIIEDNQMRILVQQKVQRISLDISLILVVILLTVGLTGNILLLAIFIKYKEMRTVPNLMIMNLAITDCISLLLNLPTQYYWGTSYWRDEWGCRTFQYSRKFAITVSTYSIVMISLQRFLAVKLFPKAGGCTIGYKIKAILKITSVWLFGFLYNIPRLTESSIVNSKCTDMNLRILPKIVAADFLFICILPSLLLVVFSAFTASNIKTSALNVPGESTGQQQLKKNRMLSAHVLTGLAVLFVISYFPYFIFQFITYTCGFYLDYDIHSLIHTHTYCLLFTNSCLNPVALGIMSKKYRKFYIELIRSFKCTSFKLFEGQSTSIASVATTETSM